VDPVGGYVLYKWYKHEICPISKTRERKGEIGDVQEL
jgi:hypothetical protein